MKKWFFIIGCLFTTLISSAQYRIMGYYPESAYGDYVVVYSYELNGQFMMSHCRTDKIRGDIFSNLSYLDINTCSIQQRNPSTAAPTTYIDDESLASPVAPATDEKAFAVPF